MKKIFTSIFLLLFAYAVMGQNVITGVITDESTGETLPGVSVVVKGTTVGTITDIDGNYTIEVPSEATLLVFSYVGMVTQEIEIGTQTTIDVILKADVHGLDEVVVIGYGVQKKSLVTGAISKVSAEKLERNQVRIEQALQGKTAGVNIMQESGSPGAGMNIRIRGTGSNRNANPLFIVDGMRTDGIEYLNPNDIESVEILKDAASAAIYGAEGGNGVVIVTTKSGSSKKSTLSYNANYGIQEVKNMNRVLNAKEYATYYREGLRHEIETQYAGFEIPEELMNRSLDISYPFNPDTLGTGTDWLNEIFSPAQMQEHNISFAGGNEKTTVFFSGSYLSQDGVVGGSKSTFKRYTARLNVDHELKDWLTFGGKVSFTHFERTSIDENNEFGGVISNAMNIDPLTPVYYSDTSMFPEAYKPQIYANFDDIDNSSLKAPGDKGYYGMSEYVQNEVRNPVAQIDNDHDLWYTDKLLGGLSATLKPFEGFTFKSTFDIDLSYGNNNWWVPEYYYHSINYSYLSSVHQSTERWFNWQAENVATYTKSIDLHNFTVMAGNTAREATYYYFKGRGEQLLEESWNFAVFDAVLSDSARAAVEGRRNEDTRLLSYFGRLQYNYGERYMLGATLRSDASSKLSSSNRTKYYPSISLGWVATNEAFWNFSPINFMKVRFSWGQNGSIQSLNVFEYVPLIETGSESSYYTSNGTVVGAHPQQVANPDLQWETSDQTNLGVDLRLLNDRLTFTTDFYVKNTIDLITEAPIPEYVGNQKPRANAGTVSNRGVEIEVSYRGEYAGIKYDVSATLAHNRNEVTELIAPLQGANLGTSGALSRTEEGEPIWYFYGFNTLGVFDSIAEINAYVNEDGELLQPRAIPGDVIFEDVNGDGTINEEDKTKIGSPHPDFLYGFNASLEYRGFDFSIFLQGVSGNEVYYGAYRTDLDNNNKPYFLYENAWTPDDNSGNYPRYSINDNNKNYSHSDLFVFDGSYLRLQSVELGYTFQKPILEKIRVSKLRVYVSGRNLHLWTKYPGADPEVGNSVNPGAGDYDYGRSIGIDRGLYPRPRIISFGLNLTI